MNLILIDDDLLVTTALKIILEADPEFHVIATGTSGAEAIMLYNIHRPDLLLLDIRMKDMSGLDAAQQILQKHPSARILLLTTFSDDEYIVKALRIGTKGYLLKQDYAHITPAIRAVYDGQTVFGDEIVQRLPDLLQKKETVDFRKFDLSEKEVDIIRLVADGLSNKGIAEALCFGEGTVRNYLSTILNKLNLRDRTQLAIWYLNADREATAFMSK
ncbi:MAG: response regulator [Lachnospiraceae bacterium]